MLSWLKTPQIIYRRKHTVRVRRVLHTHLYPCPHIHSCKFSCNLLGITNWSACLCTLCGKQRKPTQTQWKQVNPHRTQRRFESRTLLLWGDSPTHHEQHPRKMSGHSTVFTSSSHLVSVSTQEASKVFFLRNICPFLRNRRPLRVLRSNQHVHPSIRIRLIISKSTFARHTIIMKPLLYFLFKCER